SPALATNDGSGRFTDARPGAGPYFSARRSGRGAAFADFDNDGDLDIVVNHVDHQARAALLRNDTSRDNHWVGFELRGCRPGTAHGADVWLEAAGLSLVRVLQPNAGYLSGNDPRIQFGLGEAARVARLEVRWPSGRRQVWNALAVDRYWVLEESCDGSRKPL
ncbi:MAG: CRTAC1 family protein, partial [Thermoanaerobaculia bacterium]